MEHLMAKEPVRYLILGLRVAGICLLALLLSGVWNRTCS